MPQFIPAPAASSGGGGGWTAFVELESTDDNLTLTSGDNGTIIKCVTYYVFEEANNQHLVYLPAAAVGLQFAIYAMIPDEGLQSNIAVIPDGSDLIYSVDSSNFGSVMLTSDVEDFTISSLFIAVTGGWIIFNASTYLNSHYAYWQTIIPEPG